MKHFNQRHNLIGTLCLCYQPMVICIHQKLNDSNIAQKADNADGVQSLTHCSAKKKSIYLSVFVRFFFFFRFFHLPRLPFCRLCTLILSDAYFLSKSAKTIWKTAYNLLYILPTMKTCIETVLSCLVLSPLHCIFARHCIFLVVKTQYNHQFKTVYFSGFVKCSD